MTIQQQIIEILGLNATDLAVFNENLEVDAIYTWKGDIYCLHRGLDFPFEDLTQRGQKDLLQAVKTKNYVVDKTFQQL
jgi:hypothetical protein